MKRALATVFALVAAQALLLGVWFAVERNRDPAVGPGAGVEVEAVPAPSPQQTSEMDRPLPELALSRLDGSTLHLSETLGRPLVLHFWATWCPPCREELPGLLAYAAEGGLPVLAVSLDADWETIRRFLGSDPPPPVVLGEGELVTAAFDVPSLPVTFVVDAAGSLRLRLDGPRDWEAAALRSVVAQASR